MLLSEQVVCGIHIVNDVRSGIAERRNAKVASRNCFEGVSRRSFSMFKLGWAWSGRLAVICALALLLSLATDVQAGRRHGSGGGSAGGGGSNGGGGGSNGGMSMSAYGGSGGGGSA